MRLDRGQIEVLEDEMVAVLQSKSPAERLAMAGAMWSFARRMILGRLRADHPDWDEQRLVQEAARRLSHGAV